MCTTCGCGDEDGARLTTLHAHDHEEPHTHTVVLEQRVLAKNDDLAAANRVALRARDLVMVNLMSSPGSGKTTLLERTVAALGVQWPVCVLEGDQETTVDAERIRAAGARAVQINTGAGCHLDAAQVARGLQALDPPGGALVVVENVGNLVCPALFDLGETRRVVVMSVTEGDDKPAKYPHMFRTADLVLINKIDLAPYVDFDLERCAAQLRRLAPTAGVLPISATRGDGLGTWCEWLRELAASTPHAVSQPV